jgi:hypothetical protein
MTPYTNVLRLRVKHSTYSTFLGSSLDHFFLSSPRFSVSIFEFPIQQRPQSPLPNHIPLGRIRRRPRVPHAAAGPPDRRAAAPAPHGRRRPPLLHLFSGPTPSPVPRPRRRRGLPLEGSRGAP